MTQIPLQIFVMQGSILEVEAQAIVNAANSSGAMGGGVAGVIRRAAGSEVEKEAMDQAPISVGHAVVTSGWKNRVSRHYPCPHHGQTGHAHPG